MYKIIIICTSILLAGCVTPPRQYQFDNSIEVKDSYDNTWTRVVEIFARNNIQIKNIAKDSGLISAETSKFGTDVADCGELPLFNIIKRYGNVNVFIKTNKNNTQLITVNTDFRITAISTTGGNIIDRACNSTGNLERAIFTKVNQLDY